MSFHGTMMNNFALTPALVRELGYLLNSNRHNGWAERTAEFLGVSPRTVEAWARGERECEGPPALLMAHLARMVVQETYLNISLYEVEKLVERHGRKTSLDLALPEVRRGIRSLIKLHSSIQRVAGDMAVNRSALSRWLSGENALGIDGVSKILDYIGLNRDPDSEYKWTWRISLDWDSLDEASQNLQDAIKIFFPTPPECLLTQVGELQGRFARFKANLINRKTEITVELSMPMRLARHDQGLNWLLSTFGLTSSLTIYCPLDIEMLKENNAAAGCLDTNGE
jgi:transcriptional regulator with XRE-family HTH domain